MLFVSSPGYYYSFNEPTKKGVRFVKHFLSADALSKEEMMQLFQTSEQLQQQSVVLPEQLFAANLFFEPSTRTKSSFMMAEKKLGMETLDFSAESSSMLKGETLYDTAKTFEAIGANMLVIRHEADDWPLELQEKLSIPVINAGAGKKEHPTQSLLDADTIHQEFGGFDGLKIVIAGDIVHSRVAHSNAKLLTKLGAKVYVTGAPAFMDETLDYPTVTMDEAVEIADVLMLLRIQHERHQDLQTDAKRYHETYGLTVEREKRMQAHAIVLHPAPVNRGVEIATSLVECDRSRIFKQMTNGVYIRMAIIIRQLLQWGLINENQINECKNPAGQPASTLYRAN